MFNCSAYCIFTQQSVLAHFFKQVVPFDKETIKNYNCGEKKIWSKSRGKNISLKVLLLAVIRVHTETLCVAKPSWLQN